MRMMHNTGICLAFLTVLLVVATKDTAFAAPWWVCHLPVGKEVTISENEGTFTYQHYKHGAVDLKLSGSALNGNLFRWEGRYTGLEMQIRFAHGDYSYIAYSASAGGEGLGQNFSGVEVIRGDVGNDDKHDISDQTCIGKNPGFDPPLVYDDLPLDDDSWSAM